MMSTVIRPLYLKKVSLFPMKNHKVSLSFSSKGNREITTKPICGQSIEDQVVVAISEGVVDIEMVIRVVVASLLAV